MKVIGKTALVTGSSRGIGKGIAIKLAEKGVSKICINYLKNTDDANDTLAKVKAAGGDGFICQADVSRPEEISKMFGQIKEKFGSLDIMVSNARSELGSFYEPALDIPLEKFESAFDEQSRAYHLCVRESVKLMSNGGRIIGITYAPSARTGSWAPWVAMGAAKAAMESLTRYYAVALGTKGITVNNLSPGVIDDSVVSRLPEEVFGAIKQWHASGWTPMRRLGTPADCGNVVALLCTEEAGFVTGQTLYVDGGAGIMDSLAPLPIQGSGE